MCMRPKSGIICMYTYRTVPPSSCVQEPLSVGGLDRGICASEVDVCLWSADMSSSATAYLLNSVFITLACTQRKEQKLRKKN